MLLFLLLACFSHRPPAADVGAIVLPPPPASLPPAPPTPEGVVLRYYPAPGSTWEEISANWGEELPGVTHYRFSKGVATEVDAQGCRVTEVDLSWQIEVELPQWHPPADPDPTVVAQWHGFDRELRVHEYGHVAIVQAAIPAMERALLAAGCEEHQDAAQAWMDRIDAWNERYDEGTDHGVRQESFDLEALLAEIRATGPDGP